MKLELFKAVAIGAAILASQMDNNYILPVS